MTNIRSPLAVGANTFETFLCVPGAIFYQLNSSTSERDLAMKQSADRGLGNEPWPDELVAWPCSLLAPRFLPATRPRCLWP